MPIDMSQIKFDDRGLIPVIVQDSVSGQVLMMAYANEESLQLTERTGEMVFFSRSRKALWHKGETSGNTMKLVEMRLDCDGDTLLALVEPSGPACHTGEKSCFYRTIAGVIKGDPAFYGNLWRYLLKRKNDSPEESYTARLIQKGLRRVAQKVGEEGVETALAIAAKDRDETIYESADLLYHLLVALAASDIDLQEIWAELESRHKR